MQQRGVSLVELIIVMAVLAIAVSVGVPSFRDLIRDNRIVATSNELLAGLAMARTTAIQQNTRVRLCASDNPEAAVPVCSAGNDWSKGWVVMADSDRDGGAFEAKIAATPAVGAGVEVIGNVGAVIIFQNNGLSPGNNGTLSVCDERKNDPQGYRDMRNVVLSAAGRGSVRAPKNSGELEC